MVALVSACQVSSRKSSASFLELKGGDRNGPEAPGCKSPEGTGIMNHQGPGGWDWCESWLTTGQKVKSICSFLLLNEVKLKHTCSGNKGVRDRDERIKCCN